ncbi:MAG: ABC transporter ATP-binding protein/permease [Oscillospiraceae bacterium]|nr:ABC transporter ATP-binding protein/permease [Oscillospiraceae bacterium]
MRKKIGIKKLFSYYKPYKKLLFIDLFISAFTGLLVVGASSAILYVKDLVIKMEKEEAFKVIVVLMAVIPFYFALIYFCDYFIICYGHIIGAKIEKDMKLELFSHLQTMPLSFYDNKKTGKLVSRFTTDLDNISDFLHDMPEDVVIFGIRLIGTFTILFFFNKTISLITISIIMFIVIISLYFIPKIHRAFVKNNEENSKINSQIDESLSGIKIVKSFSNEKIEIEKFKKANENFVKRKKISIKIFSKFYSLTASCVLSIIPTIVILSLFLINKGFMSVDDLVTYIVYADLIIAPIHGIISIVEQFQKSMAGYQRFSDILSVKSFVDSKNAVELTDVKGDIIFKNVSFNYKPKGEAIFSNLNLNIKAGEYIALVGSSGAGKSTLCSLIPRFYETSSGSITLDGVNVQDIKMKSLRKNIGFVMQDTYLFADTIKANISYGNPDSTDEEIVLAAKHAWAHDFIMSFPNGYNTYIGQRGSKLSGGQKQRLAIARVFLKNPPILIFDEATSALDLQSEKYVHESMEKLSKGRTTIVIAHRLSTIKKAKRILVLTNKGIVEQGNHDELLAKKGVYYELSNLM